MSEYTPISVMSYKGSFVGVEEALNQGIFQNGDVICVDRDTYVFIDEGFVKLSENEPCAASSGTQPESSTLTEQKCRCCGAPLIINRYSHHAIKCEYCGSAYSY